MSISRGGTDWSAVCDYGNSWSYTYLLFETRFGQPGSPYVAWPRCYKSLSCSTQLSMKFQLLIKLKFQQIKKFLALSLSGVVFIMLINAKMPTIVGILPFMSRINFVLS